MDVNSILFGQFPYLALTIAIVGTIYRYQSNRFSWSSQSSQFLENKTLFYGSVPWHYGILFVLLFHFVALFIPPVILSWNAAPLRLYLLEISGLAFAILALVGLLVAFNRRLTNSRVRAVTTSWDIIVLIVLLIQVFTGILTAVLYKWGSNWLAASAAPWFWSVLTLQPKVEYVASLPLLTKIHIFNALLFIALIPFTRFVHFLAFIGPLKYLGRSYQLVRWYNRNERTPAIRQYK